MGNTPDIPAAVSIDRQSVSQSEIDTCAPYDGDSSLKGTGLVCERNDQLLFSDLAFRLGPGELLQVDGPNGSGKTTLLRILCGLLAPDDGEVSWCGTPIRKIKTEFFANLVFVGHKLGIKDELTPVENLRIDRALRGSQQHVAPREALRSMGIGDHQDVPCRFLSAGQRRRVALSRLLVSRAQLWILDEPLTALDKHGQKMMRDTLVEHAGRGGMTVFTTHLTFDFGQYPVSKISLGS
ncbi:MAG: cytochrome c biogenesis heme-transporting ATPase CcmA [Gammaproteobacteria bacterium]|nr:cytochrome c biogenesis heme-transporting ATPase CcmA [Gammaproteobacteria bacterium]